MGGNGVYLGVGVGCVFPIIIGNYREIIEDLSETIGNMLVGGGVWRGV